MLVPFGGTRYPKKRIKRYTCQKRSFGWGLEIKQKNGLYPETGEGSNTESDPLQDSQRLAKWVSTINAEPGTIVMFVT